MFYNMFLLPHILVDVWGKYPYYGHMKTQNQIVENCPKCGCPHTPGEYQEYQEAGQTIHARPDIQCKCGLALRPVVPVIKRSASGTVLVPKKDHYQFRKAGA